MNDEFDHFLQDDVIVALGGPDAARVILLAHAARMIRGWGPFVREMTNDARLEARDEFLSAHADGCEDDREHLEQTLWQAAVQLNEIVGLGLDPNGLGKGVHPTQRMLCTPVRGPADIAVATAPPKAPPVHSRQSPAASFHSDGELRPAAYDRQPRNPKERVAAPTYSADHHPFLRQAIDAHQRFPQRRGEIVLTKRISCG